MQGGLEALPLLVPMVILPASSCPVQSHMRRLQTSGRLGRRAALDPDAAHIVTSLLAAYMSCGVDLHHRHNCHKPFNSCYSIDAVRDKGVNGCCQC